MILLTTKYSIFAGLAISGNLFIQYLSLKVYKGEYDLYAAMFLGTITGLLIKYILDKRYIFYYSTKNRKEDIYKFIIYSFMGVFTTIIFWSTELTFNYLFDFEAAKFIGAFIGLTAGYTSKYFLDKKFVFN